MKCARLAGVGLALALGLAAPEAVADPEGLEEALRLYRQGALSESMSAFDRALSAGGNDRAGLAAAYLHLGTLRAGARDPEGAARAFESLLSLDPTATLPTGASPLVTEPFERARARRGEAAALGADVRVPGRVPVGRTLAVDVAVHGDPGGLTREARAAAETEAGPARATASGAPPFRLSLPASATAVAGVLRLRITLHDEHGSVLDETQTATAVAATAPGSEPGHDAEGGSAAPRGDPARVPRRDEDDGGGSVLGSPWFWGGAAVVVAGGVVAAFLLTTGDDQAHFGAVEVQR
jgi:hypothetical protein